MIDSDKHLIQILNLSQTLFDFVNDKILELALISDFKDFEDAIQYHTALENELDLIITRNKKDFKTSALPVLTAKEYLKK